MYQLYPLCTRCSLYQISFCVPEVPIFISVVPLCTTCTSLYQIYLSVPHVPLCTRRYSVYQTPLCVPDSPLCTRLPSVYQAYFSVLVVLLCTRRSSIYIRCTRRSSIYIRCTSLPRVLLCTRSILCVPDVPCLYQSQPLCTSHNLCVPVVSLVPPCTTCTLCVPDFPLCTRRPSVYQSSFPVPGVLSVPVVPLCTSRTSLYQMSLRVPSVPLCTRSTLSVPDFPLCTRRPSVYQTSFCVPDVLLCTRSTSVYQFLLCTSRTVFARTSLPLDTSPTSQSTRPSTCRQRGPDGGGGERVHRASSCSPSQGPGCLSCVPHARAHTYRTTHSIHHRATGVRATGWWREPRAARGAGCVPTRHPNQTRSSSPPKTPPPRPPDPTSTDLTCPGSCNPSSSPPSPPPRPSRGVYRPPPAIIYPRPQPTDRSV